MSEPNTFEIVSAPKPYVVKETTIPGKDCIRVVRMSDGTVHVYYRQDWVGTVTPTMIHRCAPFWSKPLT